MEQWSNKSFHECNIVYVKFANKMLKQIQIGNGTTSDNGTGYMVTWLHVCLSAM